MMVRAVYGQDEIVRLRSQMLKQKIPEDMIAFHLGQIKIRPEIMLKRMKRGYRRSLPRVRQPDNAARAIIFNNREIIGVMNKEIPILFFPAVSNQCRFYSKGDQVIAISFCPIR
jgi:hypothetical protein